MHVLSHQRERVRGASSGDCSTEHSRFAAVPLPWRFWWKLALRVAQVPNMIHSLKKDKNKFTIQYKVQDTVIILFMFLELRQSREYDYAIQ